MAQVVIRNIDDDAMARPRARARREGVSLERELRAILIETARLDEAGFRERGDATNAVARDRPGDAVTDRTVTDTWQTRRRA
jgi:plasmid stability protein